MNTRNFFALVFTLFLLSCTQENNNIKQGPENSWWLGGADGGVYIKISDDENPNDRIYQGAIFYDFDKTIWYRGRFKLVGELPFDTGNRDQYLFWDGEKVHLQQSSYLEAIDPIPAL